MRALQHTPVAHDCRGVVFPDRAAFVARREVEIDEAHDRGDAAGGLGNPQHRALVGREEPRVLDEVPDAIAGQRHFRRHEYVGPLGRRGLERLENLRRVPVDVTARGIELSERNTHRLKPSRGAGSRWVPGTAYLPTCTLPTCTLHLDTRSSSFRL